MPLLVNKKLNFLVICCLLVVWSHLHDRVLQEAGSCCCCCCSSDTTLPSNGRQAAWVLFQTQLIPGQAWLQDAGLGKAEQLGEVYMRTSLSSRLLKPPNTYMTLQDRGGDVKGCRADR